MNYRGQFIMWKSELLSLYWDYFFSPFLKLRTWYFCASPAWKCFQQMSERSIWSPSCPWWQLLCAGLWSRAVQPWVRRAEPAELWVWHEESWSCLSHTTSNHRGSGAEMSPCSEWQKLIISDNDWQPHSLRRSDAQEQLLQSVCRHNELLGDTGMAVSDSCLQQRRALTAKSLSAKVLQSLPATSTGCIHLFSFIYHVRWGFKYIISQSFS